MENAEIQKYAEHLFQIALARCQNLSDAEDLTQETLLAALQYQKPINNMEAWLGTVLNRKYYDMLRKKYRLPVVSIDLVPETEDHDGDSCPPDRPDAEAVRREVAYLGEKYRTVIVRHYFYGEKVQDIADDLGIPKGTVLSRLWGGREQMRKGFDEMEGYEKQSYSPERLEVSCSGSTGFRDEPYSLVEGDLMKQNILIAAYKKPVTAMEIAKALGIPTAYIETAVNDLTESQLMCRNGNRYFTDFMIMTPADRLKGLDVQIRLVEEAYGALLSCVNGFLDKMRALECCVRLQETKRRKLEYYFILELFVSAVSTAQERIVPSKEEYPQRPDGGRWVAQGSWYPRDFDFENYRFRKYRYGGCRREYRENFLNAKSIMLQIYDTQPDLNKYQHGPVELSDDNLAKLLYILSRGIPFEATGFDPVFLKDIPHLTECGILKSAEGEPAVDIPMLTPGEYRAIDNLRIEYMYVMVEVLQPKLQEIHPRLKIEIPEHLEGRVAEFRQYPCYSIPIIFMKKAIADGDFDDSGATPPMVLVIDEQNRVR